MDYNNNNNTPKPPPSYQPPSMAEGVTGQTYYQSPPQPPPDGANYMPPDGPPPEDTRNRFVQFYAPPDNKSLAVKRRVCSIIFCCICIGLIIGLAAGLTRQLYYSHLTSTQCNCRYDTDCTRAYGTGTFCYSNCQCARR